MQIEEQDQYFKNASREYELWCRETVAQPSVFTSTTRGLQRRINRVIPEGIHKVITKAVKETTKAVISGSAVFTLPKSETSNLEETEKQVRNRINFYSKTSATEGAITGFGGFVSGLADFPLWLTLKMKMLFEIANIYGFDIDDYRERLYVLYVFQLTFCAPDTKRELFELMKNWEDNLDALPATYQEFDWKTFQLEYRDHIDLAKLIQLIPGFGAIAGALVNHKYTQRLGENAIQCYRMRLPEFNSSL